MKTYLEIFKELNAVPRPSHHEELVADYLCRFASERGLDYSRDANNCVVIRKPASPGCEKADTVVILNHMDMVCVAKEGYLRDGRRFDPLKDGIRAYVETDEAGERWMKAEGTSLGADNGMGLSMALAILDDDSLVHPALEVLTTTNEEDGMSGAEGLSTSFISGRKVVNLDSEAYDEITVGAAGACLQVGRWNLIHDTVPEGYAFFKIVIDGGLGGHSGVDINKGRCNCNKELASALCRLSGQITGLHVCSIEGGTANASIASCAEAVIAVPQDCSSAVQTFVCTLKDELSSRFADTDHGICALVCPWEDQPNFISNASDIIRTIASLPFGVLEMRSDMPGTVMTSNNIGIVKTDREVLTVSCHTRSFSNEEQDRLSASIRSRMTEGGAADVEMLMNTGSWVERADSPLLDLTCRTFRDVLGFEPRKVAMHFVLEAAYYVEKYPGVEIASIGPRIIEPHSTSERVSLDTAEGIWKVTVELLRRLARLTNPNRFNSAIPKY